MKPHYSATQIELFSKCPEAWYRRYIKGDRMLPVVSMLKGTALHAAAETNFRQKRDTRRDLPARMIVDIACCEIEAVPSDEVALTPEERSVGADLILGDAVDAVKVMADFHARKQAPHYQPVLVEAEVRVQLPGPRDLLAKLDLADSAGVVTDFKNGSTRRPPSDAHNSIQLTIYGAAYMAQMKRPAAKLQLDRLIYGPGRKPEREVLETTRGPADYTALAHRINTMTAAIEAGNFPPTSPGNWYCGAKSCAYWSTCRFVNSERTALSEQRPF